MAVCGVTACFLSLPQIACVMREVLCPFCSLLYPQCLCCIGDLAGAQYILDTWMKIRRGWEWKGVGYWNSSQYSNSQLLLIRTVANVFQPIFWGLLNLSVPWSLAWLIGDCSRRNRNQWAESSMAGITPDTFRCYSCWQLTLGVSQDNLGAFKIQILLLHLYMNWYIPWIRTSGVEHRRASVWYSISWGDSHCYLLSGYS